MITHTRTQTEVIVRELAGVSGVDYDFEHVWRSNRAIVLLRILHRLGINIVNIVKMT